MKEDIRNIIDKLKKKGYTFTDLASYVGVGEQTLCKWRTGKTKAKKGHIIALQGLLEKEKNAGQ